METTNSNHYDPQDTQELPFWQEDHISLYEDFKFDFSPSSTAATPSTGTSGPGDLADPARGSTLPNEVFDDAHPYLIYLRSARRPSLSEEISSLKRRAFVDDEDEDTHVSQKRARIHNNEDSDSNTGINFDRFLTPDTPLMSASTSTTPSPTSTAVHSPHATHSHELGAELARASQTSNSIQVLDKSERKKSLSSSVTWSPDTVQHILEVLSSEPGESSLAPSDHAPLPVQADDGLSLDVSIPMPIAQPDLNPPALLPTIPDYNASPGYYGPPGASATTVFDHAPPFAQFDDGLSLDVSVPVPVGQPFLAPPALMPALPSYLGPPGASATTVFDHAPPFAQFNDGLSLDVSIPVPVGQPFLAPHASIPTLPPYLGPPGASTAAVGMMPIFYGYPPILPPPPMPYPGMPFWIPQPPSLMIAPTPQAAIPFTVAPAPVAVVPQAAPVALHPIAPIPATTVQPVHALPTVAAPAAPAAQPEHALWQSLVTTLDTTLWPVDFTLGHPVDNVLAADYLNAFTAASIQNPQQFEWKFQYSGNPNATPPRPSRQVHIKPLFAQNDLHYDGIETLNRPDYRCKMIEKFPYLSIRALEQERFTHVFHAKDVTVSGGEKTWMCPHCGGLPKGQPKKLKEHFEGCDVLKAVEKQVRKANN
ncbi:hypothetical protein CYLTODRAFT_456137 [Cylindrobasidium torrendii FP15055 ss-10]|uniref:Uncharacterized protein n=1 Tax=Cylindrobasidium torrendii FP15055 ss-10 TaxID=1314674 RepID=A0A0D7B5X2_9AGAR|nr:hypothetical protein CYLTODRAFT_456137 [Cylindrobasidium torrendii FP15055 ss-10]